MITWPDYAKGGDPALTTAPPGLFVTVHGNRLPITNMFRPDGCQTTEPAQACRVVAQLPDGMWGVFTVLPGDIERLQ